MKSSKLEQPPIFFIREIYQQAEKELQNANTLNEKEEILDKHRTALIPLLKNNYDINFGEAQNLDSEYFGVNGKYWISGFDNPKIGEEFSQFYDDWGFVTFRCIEKGLLTMSLKHLNTVEVPTKS